MEKRNQKISNRVPPVDHGRATPPVAGSVAGIDLGDRVSEVCVYTQGVILDRFQFSMTLEGLRAAFAGKRYAKIAMEAGAQSPWVTRELRALGYEPLVANPRKLKAISANERKSDRNDALMLARLAAADASLLHPIHHRSAERADALAVLKARNCAVVGRARVIHTIRALAKAMGFRFKRTSTDGFVRQASEAPEALVPAVAPLFTLLGVYNEQIKLYDDQLADMAEHQFPETHHLLQVHGVGPVTALAYVLVIEDPGRYRSGRIAAAFLGLVPRRDQSGSSDRQLGISKTGNTFVRRLLVQCAQYILGPNGRDCDIRRWGHKLADRGGKNAKKRAIVATARRLAVLLFRLWKRGETWTPLFNASAELASRPPETTSGSTFPTPPSSTTAPNPLTPPPKVDVEREIAASSDGSDSTMHRAAPGPQKSADRSKDHGKAPRKSTRASPGKTPESRVPGAEAPAPALRPSPVRDTAERAGPGTGAGLRPSPVRDTAERAGPGTGAGLRPSPVRRVKVRSSS